ncbi:Putative methyltransferase [Lawsonella clevelandensis]|mgnify:CR=1 FL=1|uniref:Methyltransferase n=2 Tax=Lawsonella clevelandensis TaxID=1528099 RepID=A0A5E3ZW45_9ACTN|nr:transcription antitermination factor NusB [Lawsonella clevelandensis]MDU7193735.1 transcription antitermination factor NusB [Lawsonella clevelandensis]VHN99532.1 Putative methyltransferase [Lawsonella clevelandensis]
MSGGFRSRSKTAAKQRNAEPSRATVEAMPKEGKQQERNGSSAPKRHHAHRRRGTVVEDPARETALTVIRAVRADEAYANIMLSQELRHRHLNKQDAAFATELANGTVRAQGVLDPIIAEAAHRPVADIDGDLLDVLRIGAYQLLRTRVPQHAAVATSTELVRAERGQGSAGFVNAVLRTISRSTPEEWQERCCPQATHDPLGALAYRTAHPRWIAEAFAGALRVDEDSPELAAALAADDTRPIVHLVALPGEATAEEVAAMTGGDISPLSPYAVHLTEGGDPGRLEVVREGHARVQDEGSQIVALTLRKAPLEGDDQGRWLDLCAGPGGKAALLGAEAAIAGATVVAVEPSHHRADLVRNACEGRPVTVVEVDGRDTGLEGGFDRILVDAPCSGLGSLRRRPESRWRRQPSDLADLTRLQRELLISASTLVRPGGVIAYSTCSPHLRETEAVVRDVAVESGLDILDATALWPEWAQRGGAQQVTSAPFLQLWPHRHGTDAMFVSLLKRPVSSLTQK